MQKINWLIFVVLLSFYMSLSCKVRNLSCKDNYPPKVTNLGVESEYDEAKWVIYWFYSQCVTDIFIKTSEKIDTINTNVSYLTLPLTMTYIESQNDTLKFSFFFLPEKGFIKTDPKCQDLNGVGFVGDDNSVDFFDFGDHWIRLTRKEFSLEFDENEINQVFRQTLRKERSNLNPWLLNKAKEKGEL